MNWFNAALGGLVTGLLYPFRTLPPIVGLGAISLLTSIGILLVYRVASNQQELRRTKDQIMAGILEIRLFRDDLVLIARAQLDILRTTAQYLRLSLIPMLWVLAPVILLLIQLQFHYGYRAFRPGEHAIVTATLRPEADPVALDALSLQVGERVMERTGSDIAVATPRLLIPGEHKALWRVDLRGEGVHTLLLGFSQAEAGVIELPLLVYHANDLLLISPRRPSTKLLDQLLYPSGPPVRRGDLVEAVEIDYPEATVSLFGWEVHWIIAFFLLTIVFGFALQRPLGVTI